MTGKYRIMLAGALAALLMTGCGLTSPASAESTAAETATALSAALEADVSERDASGEYDAAEAVMLSPGSDLTITEAGVYLLSGSYEEQMIVIEAGEEDKVQLVLDNASISNAEGPAIYVRSADKVFLTAAAGTENTISDGSSYSLSDGESTLDAAVFSKADLTINGAGKLTINGNYKHAVVSKDDLVVTAKDLSICAENVGLNGKDSVTLSEATVSITAGSDGVRSDNGEDAERGYVYVLDSALTITAGKDGIQAETDFASENAEISITAGGSASGAYSTESGKGIKAGVSLIMNGGVCSIDSLDDAIHTNGSLMIGAGSYSLRSGDDGIHADEKAEISGGTLEISAAEGIEGSYVLVSGGEITIQASDDGINAARKSSTYAPSVEITGGSISITMGAGDTDGIDSNGSLIISGGTISINAHSPFDYDGSASFTGGTVYVNGQQVSTLTNQMMGGPGGMGGFGNVPGGGQGGFPGGQGGFPGGQGGFPGGRP